MSNEYISERVVLNNLTLRFHQLFTKVQGKYDKTLEDAKYKAIFSVDKTDLENINKIKDVSNRLLQEADSEIDYDNIKFPILKDNDVKIYSEGKKAGKKATEVYPHLKNTYQLELGNTNHIQKLSSERYKEGDKKGKFIELEEDIFKQGSLTNVYVEFFYFKTPLIEGLGKKLLSIQHLGVVKQDYSDVFPDVSETTIADQDAQSSDCPF